MALWVDKYRPTELSELTYNVEQLNKLAKFVTLGDFPHLMFCGPSGAGKRTRINCLLRELYGTGVENVHIIQKEFQSNSGKKFQVNIINSIYHLELTPRFKTILRGK
jgi:replication factor C subunit 3/5